MNAIDYLENLSDDRREALEAIREMIAEEVMDLNETMQYRMPTYVMGENVLCALASQKHYMALYIMPYDLLPHFKEDLKAYNCGKSCIRFKKIDKDDLDLFRKIIRYSAKHYPESALYGKVKGE